MDAAVAARLSAGIRGLGLELAPAQVEALGTLLDELADWNTRMNPNSGEYACSHCDRLSSMSPPILRQAKQHAHLPPTLP